MYDEEFNTPVGPEESFTGHEYEPPSDPDYVSPKKQGFIKLAKKVLAMQAGAAAMVVTVVAGNNIEEPVRERNEVVKPLDNIEVSASDDPIFDTVMGSQRGLIILTPGSVDTPDVVVVDVDNAPDSVISDPGDSTGDLTDNTPGVTGKTDIDKTDKTDKPENGDKKDTEVIKPSVSGDVCPTCHGLGTYCEECGGTGWVHCKACNNGIEICVVCHGSGYHTCYGCWGSGQWPCIVCNQTGIGPDGNTCNSCGGDGIEGVCPHCGGSGRERCEECGGAGSYLCLHCHGNPESVTHTCRTCNGNPGVCPDCKGTGKKGGKTAPVPKIVREDKSIISLPPTVCTECNGTGIICPGNPDFGYDRGNGAGYAGCGGTGYSLCPDSWCNGGVRMCNDCLGSGVFNGETCRMCHGKGTIDCEFCGNTGIAPCISIGNHYYCTRCNGTGYVTEYYSIDMTTE